MIKLDVKPKHWKDRVTLFIGYKVDQGIQSATVRSYVLAIKRTLIEDGYPWDDTRVILGSLTKACKIINDKVHTRLPIKCSLLELILFEVQRICRKDDQVFLEAMYKALFGLAYYGLMRIGEVTISDHVVKAKDVHAAENKDKLMIKLYSSKTHNKGMRAQTIKVTSNLSVKTGNYVKRHFCPVMLIKKFLNMRGSYQVDNDQLFIFRDGSPVTPFHARDMLKRCLLNIGLKPSILWFPQLQSGKNH